MQRQTVVLVHGALGVREVAGAAHLLSVSAPDVVSAAIIDALNA